MNNKPYITGSIHIDDCTFEAGLDLPFCEAEAMQLIAAMREAMADVPSYVEKNAASFANEDTTTV